MKVTDQEIYQAFQKTPIGEVKPYVVVFKEKKGSYFQKYFYAKSKKEAVVIGREYVARFESEAIPSSAVISAAT